MRKLKGSFVIATVSVGLMFGTQATFARAALDQTPPSLTVPVRPAFVVGSVVDQRIPEDGYYFAQIPAADPMVRDRQRWRLFV